MTGLAATLEIREDDLTGAEILRLLGAHLEDMVAITPAGSVHALAADGLRSPDTTLWSAWQGGVLLGCGALRALGPECGEIKAMRTDDAHRRRGVGSRILEHILGEARRRGYRRVLLETGALPAFAPARALYGRYGFALRGPFGDYADDPNSVFMALELQPTPSGPRSGRAPPAPLPGMSESPRRRYADPPPRETMAHPSGHQGPEPHYDRVVSGYRTYHHRSPFRCDWGGELPEFEIAYETWGALSPARDNAVLLHTGLSASSHAKSHPGNESPGWWEDFIGPGQAIDTDRFFVICTNLLGGCYGSTGPASTDPRTGAPYATDFPLLTVADMVRAQIHLLDHLELPRLHASVGASLGGMQSPLLAAMAPERVGRVVSISAALRSHPQSIALRFVQRQAVMVDPDWRGGRYYGHSFPHKGQKVAREIGTITYRSGPEWLDRFGRERSFPDRPPSLDEDFQVESYLVHQGEKFCLQYDANSYLYISKAMDLFDLMAPVNGRPAIEHITCPTLVIGVRSDLLFPVWQQRELATALRKNGADTTYVELDAPYGHDTFLVDRERVGDAVKSHLEDTE